MTPLSPQRSVPVRPHNLGALVLQITVMSLVGLTIYGFTTFDTNQVDMDMALDMLGSNTQAMFLDPHLSNTTFSKMIDALFVTIGLGFLSTVIGAVIALGLALGSALNLSPAWLSITIRALTAFVRAVPTVLWVLILAVSAGLGSVAAVLGMTFHSAGYLIKAYSESFEDVDNGTLEALRACGANWWQVVTQAVIPSARNELISWTFLRFEINFSTAIAMGAAAGAGGIGFDMFMASGFYLNLHEMGAFTYTILVFALILELCATQLKRTTSK